jgi:SAM-dependent methyltransferase
LYGRLCQLWNDNAVSYWDQEYGSNQATEHWGAQFRLHFYDLAATVLPRSPATVLDAGSGLGLGAKHLMDIYKGWRIEGLDFSPKACRNAVVKTHCVDLRIEQVPGEYDYILVIQTLEHFAHPVVVLDKLYKAARKAVIVTVPYKGSISTTHPISFDEQSFSKYPNVEIKLSERKEPDGSVKTEMLVLLRQPVT